jgi:D-xylose transport system permease protein
VTVSDHRVSAPDQSPALARARRFRISSRAVEIVPLTVALCVVAIVFQAQSSVFLAPRNVSNLLVQMAPLELVAVASTIMIVMGEIDLSLGSVAGFTGALGALLLTHNNVPWPVAVGAALVAGLAVSGLQGLVVVVGRVRSFAVTLAGFFLWYGVQLWLLGSNGEQVLRRPPLVDMTSSTIPDGPALVVTTIGGVLLLAGWFLAARHHDEETADGSTGRIYRLIAGCVGLAVLLWCIWYLGTGGGVPFIFVLILAITAFVWIVLTRTALGRHFYAVGGNVEAARESGIRVTRVKWIGFAVAGCLAAFAGLTVISYTGLADSSTGGGSLLLAGIGATVVGGVSLLGGRGSVWGAFGGAILLAAVQNGLNLMNLNFYAVDIVEGIVVLAALIIDSVLRERVLVQ